MHTYHLTFGFWLRTIRQIQLNDRYCWFLRLRYTPFSRQELEYRYFCFFRSDAIFSWYVTLIREWYRTTQERVLWQGSFFKKKIDKTRSPSWLYVMNNLIIQIKQMLKHAQYRCKFCIQVRSAWLDHKRVVCSVPYKTCSCYKSYFWWLSCLFR